MLDFNKLNLQLSNIDWELETESYLIEKKLVKAFELFKNLELDELKLKIENSLEKIKLNFALPLEDINNIYTLPDKLDKFIVAATDGSQISPSRHEIAFCYLINIGRILYIYGTGDKPLQDSQPFIYYKEKDMYISFNHKKISITEDLISIERTQQEISELANLAEIATNKYTYPTLLMIDGALINFNIDNILLGDSFKKSVIERYINNLEKIKNKNIPICGYISNSRKNEFINLLRLYSCPFNTIDCDTNCTDIDKCTELGLLVDRIFWSHKLKNGERSPIFISSSSNLQNYPEYKVCFFYLKIVNNEVARLEFPLWVALNKKLVDTVHIISYDQTHKGYGYPIALSEAHHQAVIKSEDREKFFNLLSKKMLRNHQRINLSNKELKKRISIV